MLIAHRRDAPPMIFAIQVEVHPTEDPERVRAAVLALFPDAAEEPARPGTVRFSARDPSALAEKLARQRIRDTARAVFLRSLRSGRIRFLLNKQAALAGRVNFPEPGAPLGDLEVEVATEHPEAAVDILAGGGE